MAEAVENLLDEIIEELDTMIEENNRVLQRLESEELEREVAEMERARLTL